MHVDVRLEGVPEDIDDISKLEIQLCEYFTVAKKSDRSEYTVLSLLSTVRAINRFYNSNVSKVKPVNLYDKKVFSSLWEILDRKTRDLSEKSYGETNGSDSLSLRNSIKDSGFDIFIYKSKPNQCRLNNLGSADKTLIPANNPKVIADYEKYFSKWPVDADSGFYLHSIDTKSAPGGRYLYPPILLFVPPCSFHVIKSFYDWMILSIPITPAHMR
ncbi:zinc finger mym-type protein 2-like [Gigaspora margarita]|uniref:Zinc finger mym-type protein 2-like n=1 Tax=Gigaspora margarita TaxID=4874 RepID=A0A8H4ALB7_GIGMA|nr:zinc finger mym-type protein 2-like [Gigaspora margarita]